MTRILQIESSSNTQTSTTRRLNNLYTSAWQRAEPGAEIIRHDLAVETLPFINEMMIAGNFTAPQERSSEMLEARVLVDKLVDEFVAADVYAISAPMYNFGVPASLKAYIDLIIVPGKTFSFKDGAPLPLLKNKKVVIFTASGGDYTGPGAAMNFVEPYLRAVFAFMGVTDFEVIAVRGRSPEQIEAGIAAASETIDRLVSASQPVVV